MSDIDYPASDGTPIGETDYHVLAIGDALHVLGFYFEKDPDIYVAANNFIYYEEGNVGARFSPDVYVVQGVKKKARRTYKMWVEKKPPSVVFEASSRGTWLEDIGNKKALCQRLGVKEYILFDPERDYLKPPLQGFRLIDGNYVPIEFGADGTLFSETLNLKMRLTETCELRFIDPATGVMLPRMRDLVSAVDTAQSQAKAANAKADAATREAQTARTETRREARARREAELATQRETEARKSAETEVERLKSELKKLQR